MSQIDTLAPTPSRPAPAAKAVAPRWRRKAARTPGPAAALTPSDEEACPVAQLARDAATVRRLMRAVHPDGAERDDDLVGALEAPDDGVRPEELHQALCDRFRTLADMASHLRATSIKGALYQLYIAAYVSQYPEGRLMTPLSGRDRQALAETDRKATRLHYSALAHLESLAWDDDLSELRNWYYAPDYDVQQVCQQASADRPGLIAEARAKAARDAARRPEA